MTAAPRFKVGDRVTWVNPRGQTETGVVVKVRPRRTGEPQQYRVNIDDANFAGTFNEERLNAAAPLPKTRENA